MTDHSAESDATSGASSIAGVARHGNLGSPGGGVSGLLKWLALGLAVVLASVVGIGATAAVNVGSKIQVLQTDDDDDIVIPDIAAYDGPINMLLVGTDTRKNQDGDYTASGKSSDLADVIILVRISADHTNATAISFPRDLMVPIPSCPKNDGSGEKYSAMSMQQINASIQYGGVSCTVKTVEKITGIDIPFYALINFNGVIEMSNAVGGVEVCVTADVKDKDSGLNLKAGTQTLKGKQALAFLRARHSIADGSDLGRINSQQVYMSALVRKITSEGTLTDPVKVYALANATAENVQLSKSMASVDTLYSFAKAAAGIDPDRVTFLQIPTKSGGTLYPGRVLLSDKADQVIERLQSGEEIVLNPKASTGRGSVEKDDSDDESSASPSASASASALASPSASADEEKSDDYLSKDIEGQTASQETCTKVRED